MPPVVFVVDRREAGQTLAAVLKNYAILTLLWVLPTYLVLGLSRVVLLAASRRFEDAYQVVAAWGWNVVHIPGTLRRRAKAQAVRCSATRCRGYAS